MLFLITVTFGILTAALIGFGLPRDVHQVRKDDFMWNLLAGFPIMIAALQSLAFLTCYRFDSPSSYLNHGLRKQRELLL